MNGVKVQGVYLWSERDYAQTGFGGALNKNESAPTYFLINLGRTVFSSSF